MANQIDRVRQVDPKQFVWQKGRSKAKSFYDDAFVKATSAEKLHHGAFCSDAGYRAAEYTIGLHGVMHPDFRQTEYLLSFGWGATDGGGNKFCQLVWSRQLNEARARGMKMVAVDPSVAQRAVGPMSGSRSDPAPIWPCSSRSRIA